MESESIISNINNNTANVTTSTIELFDTSNDIELSTDTNIKPENLESNNNKLETKESTKDVLDTAIENKMEDQDDYDSSDLELSSEEETSLIDAENDKNNDNDDEDGTEIMPARTKHEIFDIPKIEIPDYTIKPEMDIEYIGDVLNIIDKAIIIQSQANPKIVLDIESLLCFDDRSMLGEIFETFGPVARPFYSVRFNTKDEMPNVLIGTKVFWVPSYAKSQTVQVELLKLMKGSDASNEYDEEIDESEIEFSDDEKELEYRQMRKRLKRTINKKIHSAPIIPPDLNQGRQLQSYADITEASKYTGHIVSTIADITQSISNQQQPTTTKSIKSIFDQPPPPSN